MKTFLVLSFMFAFGSISYGQDVPFSLMNKGLKSIPLHIPEVMNPNLSPYSRSGVTLPVGKKVYWYPKKGKKAELFTVSPEMRNQHLSVDSMIAIRKQEMKLEAEEK